MAGKKGNKAHANKTSYPNQKDNKKNPNVVIRKFLEMYRNAENDDEILCFQDACKSIGWRSSKVDYWVHKIPVFENLKKDIQNIIISRINKGALTSNLQATASIWRMKQLGEIDEKSVNQKGSVINYNTEITKEEAKNISDALEDEC